MQGYMQNTRVLWGRRQEAWGSLGHCLYVSFYRTGKTGAVSAKAFIVVLQATQNHGDVKTLLLIFFAVPGERGSKCFSQDVMEKLVLVLANLFGRRYLPAKFQDTTVKFYQSKVFLEDLPEDFNAALHEYNMQVTKDFASFLQIVSKLADMKQEYQLPLSKINFTGEECEDSQLVSHLMSCKEGRVAISPFVCLSGNSDGDLLQPGTPKHVILHTIGINHSQAPLLWPERFDGQGRRMPLNAYALDFYKHGSLIGLVQDNRMNEGDAYELLKDFSLTIQSISVSLRELCENEEDNVVLAFEQLSKTFREKLNKV